MTTFRAQSIQDIFAEVNAAGIQAYAQGIRWFVAVESEDGSWCALHADDLSHGKTLARCWVNTLNCLSAWVYTLNADGRHGSDPRYAICRDDEELAEERVEYGEGWAA